MRRVPVEYRPEAVADIDAIFIYTLEASQSFTTASQFTDRIFARCEKIGDAPRGGLARPDLGPDVRVVPFEHKAVIVYREHRGIVEILNVFYRGRDYDAIFRNNS